LTAELNGEPAEDKGVSMYGCSASNMEDDCSEESYSFTSLTTTICYCNTDLCNSASAVGSGTVSTLAAFLLINFFK
jgi:hypothetical protein